MSETTDPKRQEKLLAFDRILTIMDELREKCPWDKKQTIESLRCLTIEETFELSDAILDKDTLNTKKELGDILLHIIFYARIASESNQFDIAEVLNSLAEKLIYRHPHIYGDTKAETEEDVKRNWEQLKRTEKEGNKTILAGVPKSMPALIKAIRIQEKAAATGFDWDSKDQVWEKVEEELAEFKEEFKEETLSESSKQKAQAEFGDLLFSLINYARFLDINPEDALEQTNKKFISRFTYLETESKKEGKELGKMSLDEMNEYWDRAKAIERQ